jgi:hypothetical protein
MAYRKVGFVPRAGSPSIGINATDLKDELLYAHPEIRDDAGRGLVWTGAPGLAPPAASPKAVTLHIAYGSPLPCFLPHSLRHLCYDALAYAHGDQTPGRGDTEWTLSQSWIKR